MSMRRRGQGCRWLASTLSAAAALIGMTGCGPDPRMSVEQFIELQRRFEDKAPEPEAAPPDYSAIDRLLGPYRVGPGDTITVTFSGTDLPFAPTVTARIDREGNLSLPLVAPIRVAELELEDVDAVIKAAYVPGIVKDLSVHTEVATPETTRVLVVGAVQLPGYTRLRRTERNLVLSVVLAGGVTSDATGRTTLRRLRRPGEEWRFDLTDPEQVRAAMNLEPLENGDMIEVEASPRAVFIGGLVNTPGPLLLDPGVEVNLLQAIAAAGGLRTDITPREGTLIRRMPDGSDAMVKINLDKLAAMQSANLKLAAGDVLWVPHTVETRIQDWINRNIFLRAGATVNYNVSGIEFMNRHELQGGRAGGGSLEDSFDPFGFLLRNQALQGLSNP